MLEMQIIQLQPLPTEETPGLQPRYRWSASPPTDLDTWKSSKTIDPGQSPEIFKANNCMRLSSEQVCSSRPIHKYHASNLSGLFFLPFLSFSPFFLFFLPHSFFLSAFFSFSLSLPSFLDLSIYQREHTSRGRDRGKGRSRLPTQQGSLM